jgi:1-acyl-sn-glycerol-3-phosphate acyltransferase
MYFVWCAGVVILACAAQGKLAWRQGCFGTWCRIVARILHLDIHVAGKLPQPPFLLVSNHLSYVDVVVLGSLRAARFVAKQEVARWPVIGLLARSMKAIFIDRENRRHVIRVIPAIGEALAHGEGVILFAEGTTSPGERILTLKPALLQYAARNRYPVHYVTMSYATAPDEARAQNSVCWWSDMTFVPHFWRLLALSRIRVDLVVGRETIRSHDRKVLASRLHTAMERNFVPVDERTGLVTWDTTGRHVPTHPRERHAV